MTEETMPLVHESAQQIALKILQSGTPLPPLPAVCDRLFTISLKPEEDIDIAEYARIIETDPALATHILQLANSSYFGALSKIVSLRQAVMHIGLQETMSAINWMLCRKILPKFPNIKEFSDTDYWAHSWACATANRMLGRPDLMVSSMPGELYLSGLLHGIGKLILAVYRPADFRQCILNSWDFGQPLAEAEKELIGTTDVLIAYEILKYWQFPETICSAVKYYQNPEKAEERYREAAALTQLAYYIANTSGVGNNGDEFSFDLNETYLAKEGRSPLAEPATRDRHVKDILRTLQKKSSAMTGTPSTFSEEAPSAVAASATMEDLPPVRPQPAAAESLVARFIKKIKEIFSA